MLALKKFKQQRRGLRFANNCAAYLLAAAKSTHGFDGFDRPIYIFAQNRVAFAQNKTVSLQI